jgi:putative ABC transport system permease protein
MTVLRRWIARIVASLRALAGSSRADDEMREEMAAHLAMHIDENLRRGMSPDEARRAALLATGGMTAAAESAHEQRGIPWFESVMADIRYAARALIAKPGYSLAVVLTLALGIGANSAMFTIVNAVILRPLPYPDPDRIVSLSSKSNGNDIGVVDDVNYAAWRDNARSLVLCVSSGTSGVFATSAGPQELPGMMASTTYFEVYGVRPIIGRTFSAEEDRRGGPEVVVLNESLWRGQFGADKSILGKTVTIDGEPHTVIGILPASFTTTRHAQYWVPYRMREPATAHALTRDNPVVSTFYHSAYGRLRDGATVEMVRAELTAITKRVESTRSKEWRGITPVVMTLHDRRYGDRRKPLLLLLSAVGVLLTIACANLASLSLARAAGRQREMAVRLALGAGRWRLSRALLCESTLLALCGAAAGLLAAKLSIGYIVHLSPSSVGKVEDIHVNTAVLLFTFGVALLTGLAFGLAPAIAAARGDVNSVLSSGGPRTTGGRARHTAQRFLVIGQLGTALMLVTAAGLVTRTLMRVSSIDPGFQADHLVDVTMALPKSRYPDSRAAAFFDALLERVRGLPGVTSAAWVHGTPLGGAAFSYTTTDSAGHRLPSTDVVEAGSDYLRVIGATVLEGRGFDDTDRAGSERVIVLNEILAHRLFPNGGAVGRTIPFHGQTVRVVGVVKNVLQRELEVAPSAVAYMPQSQTESGNYNTLMVRASGSLNAVEGSVTRAVQALDPALAPPPMKEMTDVVAEAIAPRQFTFVLLGSFAALAGLLAVLGLYGVLANLVADRTREIGIRVALGAEPRRVTGLVLGQGASLAIVGVTLGLAGSLVAARAVRSLVYDMSVYDPWTFATGATALILVSLAASYLPARRASRVDPVIALRAE